MTNATTTQLLNLARAKEIVDNLEESQTKTMLRKALWATTKAVTGQDHKDRS